MKLSSKFLTAVAAVPARGRGTGDGVRREVSAMAMYSKFRPAVGAIALTVALVAAGVIGAASASAAHKPRVVCWAWNGQNYWRSPSRPHRCVFHERHKPLDYADEVPVNGLHWRTWGQHKALGNGTVLGNMGYRQHVRVKLTNPRRGWPDRTPYFSKLRLIGKNVIRSKWHLEVPHSRYIHYPR